MSTLNVGILAHVDAGKTSLTERLLYAAGVIDEVGSVDAGSTQTDSLALERQRGITIRTAVAAFAVGDVTVNLVDTPGHPDFIAEVERVLHVLDGAVLVVSAVEGVQAQTRILMRTLRRLRIPTVVFVNKIDRAGADPERVLREIAQRLTPAVVPMGTVHAAGTRDAAYAHGPDRLLERLAEHDDALLAAYADGRAVAYPRLVEALRRHTGEGRTHPVFFGSAITGAGTEPLVSGLAALLPAAGEDRAGPVSASVFKVERGQAGEKIAWVRVFAGTVAVRDRLRFGAGGEGRVTAIRRYDGTPLRSLGAGEIGKLSGLAAVRVGDAVGVPPKGLERQFPPPTLETVVEPGGGGAGPLRAALAQLAEQDPLINLRQDDLRQETYVSLYGEVQKEVIAATLASEYGLDAGFRETTTLHIERPLGAGSAVEFKESAPFLATVGLRVDPAPVGSGVAFRLEVELGSMPYAFIRAVEETVPATLREGLYGWQVTDCVVTMTHSGYYAPSSSAGDFRNLTPLVLMEALRKAGTRVYEPVHRFRMELPADTLSDVLSALARLDGVPDGSVRAGVLEGEIPAARVHRLQQLLPGLTRGEALLEAEFSRYRPVRGEPPRRRRTDHNPLRRKEYLLHVVRRV